MDGKEKWGQEQTKNLDFLFQTVPVDTKSVAKYSRFTITSLTIKKEEDFLNCNSQEFYYNCKAECPSRSLDLWQHLRNSVLHNKSYWTSLMEL